MVWATRRVFGHSVATVTVRIFAACVSSPYVAAFNCPTAVQAALWVILFDADSERGVRSLGHVNGVARLGF